MDDGNVRELYKANGGPWGGAKVNDAFINLLTGWLPYSLYYGVTALMLVHIVQTWDSNCI